MQNVTMEKDILNLEKKYWNAMKKQDIDTIISLTADPCIVSGAQGVMKFSRNDFISMMNAPQNYKLRDFEFSDDYQVSMINDDTAVIAYKVKESLDVEGKPVNLEAAQASTWIRRDGSWTCSLHAESITGDPFGRDRK